MTAGPESIIAAMTGDGAFAFYQEALTTAPIQSLGPGAWLVLGTRAIREICARPETFSNDISSLIAGAHHTDPDVAAVISQGYPQVQVLLMSDPPDHTRFRRLVGLAFNSQRIQQIESSIREQSQRLLSATEPSKPWDFVENYAIPLPVSVIANELGLPSSMRDKVRFWSDAFTDQLGGMINRERAIECAHAVVEFQRAMLEQIEARRTGPVNDLLAELVQASADGDDPLSDPELLSIAQQLMVAGNETSTSTLAEGIRLLVTNPDQMALLRGDPELRRGAVEEILRLASPVAGSWRIAKTDLDFHGHKIRAGDRVMIRFAAASRDPAVFENPDTMDITRSNAKTHFAFGRGIHTCLGNLLARKEIEICLEHLLDRFTDIQLAHPDARPEYPPNLMLRGLRALPILCSE